MNNNNEMGIDFNDAWRQLKPQLEAEATRREKKKRRIVFFWWSVAGIAVLGGMFYQLKDKSEKLIVRSDKEVSTIIKESGMIAKEDKLITKEDGMTAKEDKLRIKEDGIIAKEDKLRTKEDGIIAKEGKLRTKEDGMIAKEDKLQTKEDGIIAKEGKLRTKEDGVIAKEDKIERNEKRNNEKQETRNVTTSNEKQNNNQPQTQNPKQQETRNEKRETRNIILKPANPSLQVIPTFDPANGVTLLPVPEKKKATNKNITWGLRFNVPVLFGANSLDYNANAQPFTLLIPTVFVNKSFNKKHSLQVQLNPYSQYFLNNNAVIKNEIYKLTLQQGSTVTNAPQQIEYNEITTVNKIIAVEFGVSYQYQLTNKIKLGMGLFDNIAMAAVLQNIVVKDKKTTTQTKSFGIANDDREWNYINNNFIVGKLEAMYQYKKFDVGISISKPLSNMFNNIQTNASPLNTNLFLQYRF